MKFHFKKATQADIDLLVQIRIETLRAANGLAQDTPMPEVEANVRQHYIHALAHGTHTALLAYSGEALAGCGGISFYSVLPTYHNPTGQKAYLMNMYTRPAYRRQGLALHMLTLLVQEARAKGITQIQLEATPAGRSLYQKYGFVPLPNEMELPQNK